MFGIANIHKPTGPTSHDVLVRLRRRLPRKTRIGHAGTLDPFAEGVLVICLGPATRLADVVQQTRKVYRATITLGARSSTDDTEGEIIPLLSPLPPERAALDALLSKFTGTLQQIPPAHSAVHVNGQRAYKLARAGETLDLPAREVHVYRMELLDYAWPKLNVEIECGSGTYIRSLARDIGETLGVGGYCSALSRTAVGPFALSQAVGIEEFDPEVHLMNPAMLFLDGPHAILPESCRLPLAQGKPIRLDQVTLENPINPLPQPLALMDAAGNLLGLAEPDAEAGILKPRKVFIQ